MVSLKNLFRRYRDRERLREEREEDEDRFFAAAPNLGEPGIPLEATFYSRTFSSGGRVVYFNSDEAVRQSREDAARMLSDLSIWNPLDERIRETALLKWHIEPEDKSDQAQSDFAKDITKIVERIPRFLEYKRNLLMAIFHGRYAVGHEYGWEFYKGRSFLTVVDWRSLHGDKLFYDAKGNVAIRVGYHPEIAQFKIDTTQEGQVIWLDDYLRQFYAIHQAHSMDGPIEDVYSAGRQFGVGARNFVYWAWQHKNMMLQWAMDAWRRYGAGFNIWYYTEGNDVSRTEVEKIAKKQRNQAYVLVPRPLEGDKRGPGFEHIEMQHVGIEQMKQVITDYFEARIERALIGQTLSSKAEATGFNSTVADLHRDTKAAIIRADAINLQETLTKELVARIVKYNRRFFPEWPDVQLKFVFEIEDADVRGTLAAAQDLAAMGVPLDQDELRGLVGLKKPQTAPVADVSNQGQQPVSPQLERFAKAAQTMLRG